MLKLEHINLVVTNIKKTLAFYQAAFPHWTVRGGGDNDWYGKPRSWVHFGDEYQYLAFNDNGVDENRDLKGHQIGLAHFAFVTSDINGITTRLEQAGYPISVDRCKNEYRENIYFIDPNGYEVEFVEYSSDQPKQRNLYD